MLSELDASIRYTSSYYSMTKVEELMKARPNHSSLQKNGCTGTTVPGPGLVPPQHPELKELCTAAPQHCCCCWRAGDLSTGSCGGHKAATEAAGAGSTCSLPTAPWHSTPCL